MPLFTFSSVFLWFRFLSLALSLSVRVLLFSLCVYVSSFFRWMNIFLGLLVFLLLLLFWRMWWCWASLNTLEIVWIFFSLSSSFFVFLLLWLLLLLLLFFCCNFFLDWSSLLYMLTNSNYHLYYVFYYYPFLAQNIHNAFFCFVFFGSENQKRGANTKPCISFLVVFIWVFTIERTKCNGNNVNGNDNGNGNTRNIIISVCLLACSLLLGWLVCSQI